MPAEDLSQEALIQELLDWGDKHEAHLHSHIEIYEDETTGFSFRTTQDLPPQSTIINCPYGISISYLNAINTPGFYRHSEPLPQQFLDNFSEDDPNIIGHFFLMQQYLLRDKSFWWPYIRLLPQPHQSEKLGIPIWWPEEDRRFLDGTNAEPPIKTRKALWVEEWERAMSVLEDGTSKWEGYSYELYQWTATIFGTRSFRASLTIPQDVIQGERSQNPRILDHVKNDQFSFLLPILDIGNHNGINNVDWKPDLITGLSLSNRSSISAGEQVFNFYGNKSNSELLVGYGFTLPRTEGMDNDIVNLKVKPSPDALILRRAQACHVVPAVPEEEFMFAVRNRNAVPATHECFRGLSHGLVDLVICMVANKRESRFLARNTEYCPEQDPDLFSGVLRRASIRVLEILHAKIEYEISRIRDSAAALREPSNHNQKLATDYRTRQLDVLQSTLPPISNHLALALSPSSICPNAIAHQDQETRNATSGQVLSLECAFSWLQSKYPSLSTAVLRMISEDQEEPLPLNWAILVEDWAHTYWIIWIFLLSVIQLQDIAAFKLRHGLLSAWLVEMKQSYDVEISDSTDAADILHAETDEAEIINKMIEEIIQLPELSPSSAPDLGKTGFSTKLRNFASFVSEEEGVSVKYGMHDGEVVEQKVICVGERVGLGS